MSTCENETLFKMRHCSKCQSETLFKLIPTSSVLARTLEAESQRGHDATDRLLWAEMMMRVTAREEAAISRVDANAHLEGLRQAAQERAATSGQRDVNSICVHQCRQQEQIVMKVAEKFAEKYMASP